MYYKKGHGNGHDPTRMNGMPRYEHVNLSHFSVQCKSTRSTINAPEHAKLKSNGNESGYNASSSICLGDRTENRWLPLAKPTSRRVCALTSVPILPWVTGMNVSYEIHGTQPMSLFESKWKLGFEGELDSIELTSTTLVESEM